MNGKTISRRQFRGITTVADLKGRCIVDDFTDCWHWQGATSTDRSGRKCQRVWVFDSLSDRFRTMSGPMAVLEIEGTRTPETEMGWRVCRCEDCMNPAHVLGGTKKEWGNWLRNKGVRKGRPSIVAANRKNVRSRAILTQADADAIRGSTVPAAELAAQYGLKNPRYISEIRLGKRWVSPVIPGASVFTLGAR